MFDFVNFLLEDMTCMVKYGVDEVWYRSVIVRVLGNIVDVLFVDYGNLEFIFKDDICNIFLGFLKLEV